ncbi:radical SAM protein [Clostridium sp. LBM24168]
MLEELRSCKLCPKNCGINRLNNELGFCMANKNIKIAKVSLHKWEEPCISGTKGSGTVFFSNCNLKCIFCQNHIISSENFGKEITIERLSDIFLEQQKRGAHNINLVSPIHYIPQIRSALYIAKCKGLNLPILFNTNSYANLQSIKSLDGYIDVYLPDLKYFDNKYAIKYSNAPNYFKYASRNIAEMVKQVGKVTLDNNGIIIRGVIIRHLMLPGLLFDSKKIMDYISSNFSDSVYISLMNQYTPMYKVCKFPELNRALDPKHYSSMIDYCLSIGLNNGFIQDSGTSSKNFIPDFNLDGI